MEYIIKRIAHAPAGCNWDSPIWRTITPLAIDQFHPQSSDHHPIVQAKVAHSGDAIHAIYRVQDRYVKSVSTEFQQFVCWDSCVEIFMHPRSKPGYFNFEFSCGGNMLLWYIEDPTYVDGRMKKTKPVSLEQIELMTITTTLPKTTPVEITEPIEWRLECSIPLALMEPYTGPLGDLSGQVWRGNLFKCADHTSHPHWASWRPIGEALNFHQPDKFGELRFM